MTDKDPHQSEIILFSKVDWSAVKRVTREEVPGNEDMNGAITTSRTMTTDLETYRVLRGTIEKPNPDPELELRIRSGARRSALFLPLCPCNPVIPHP